MWNIVFKFIEILILRCGRSCSRFVVCYWERALLSAMSGSEALTNVQPTFERRVSGRAGFERKLQYTVFYHTISVTDKRPPISNSRLVHRGRARARRDGMSATGHVAPRARFKPDRRLEEQFHGKVVGVLSLSLAWPIKLWSVIPRCGPQFCSAQHMHMSRSFQKWSCSSLVRVVGLPAVRGAIILSQQLLRRQVAVFKLSDLCKPGKLVHVPTRVSLQPT